MPKGAKKSGKRHQQKQQQKIPVIRDIETGNYDDVLTVVLAVTHPRIETKAITITPGSMDQIRLIQFVLVKVGGPKLASRIRFGAQEWPQNRKKKGCVNLQQYAKILDTTSKELETFPVSNESQISPASQLIVETCLLTPTTTLFTGGPLHNLGAALQHSEEFSFQRWVAQGGFCGVGVVPDHVDTLETFVGRSHCPTWNFGGSIEATKEALRSERIKRRVLVGKNVCHRCTYNASLDQAITEATAEPLDYSPEKIQALHLVQTMTKLGKKLHDPLAFATLVNEKNVCDLVEVEVSVNGRNEWGSIPAVDTRTNTFAAVEFSFDRFADTILE